MHGSNIIDFSFFVESSSLMKMEKLVPLFLALLQSLITYPAPNTKNKGRSEELHHGLIYQHSWGNILCSSGNHSSFENSQPSLHPAQCLNFAFLEARLLDEGVSCAEWKRVEEIKDEDILRQWLGRERSDVDELSDSDLSRTGN
ncbi:hypothetical protein MUK42_21364 [Musa troglodytarum]|uniref:Uncharacterized protein n=1 Tax=Musa troglodytarum TaxID=320322 RepID=A0A9E7G132_9LILI|nr:hypothetical protein MUK42_21364 [Musa troglodytarum]URE05670.1 hypothetical protein MUK42_21364 [Musa troglodytarum]